MKKSELREIIKEEIHNILSGRTDNKMKINSPEESLAWIKNLNSELDKAQKNEV